MVVDINRKRASEQKSCLEPYYISMSRAELQDGVLGNRHFYNQKDLGSYSFGKDDTIPANPIFILVDVVSHMSSVQIAALLEKGPIIAYTWAPQAPAGVSNEFMFRYNGTWKFEADSAYEHDLWHFDDAGDVHTVETERETPRFRYLVLAIFAIIQLMNLWHLFAPRLVLRDDCSVHSMLTRVFGTIRLYLKHPKIWYPTNFSIPYLLWGDYACPWGTNGLLGVVCYDWSWFWAPPVPVPDQWCLYYQTMEDPRVIAGFILSVLGVTFLLYCYFNQKVLVFKTSIVGQDKNPHRAFVIMETQRQIPRWLYYFDGKLTSLARLKPTTCVIENGGTRDKVHVLRVHTRTKIQWRAVLDGTNLVYSFDDDAVSRAGTVRLNANTTARDNSYLLNKMDADDSSWNGAMLAAVIEAKRRAESHAMVSEPIKEGRSTPQVFRAEASPPMHGTGNRIVPTVYDIAQPSNAEAVDDGENRRHAVEGRFTKHRSDKTLAEMKSEAPSLIADAQAFDDLVHNHVARKYNRVPLNDSELDEAQPRPAQKQRNNKLAEKPGADAMTKNEPVALEDRRNPKDARVILVPKTTHRLTRVFLNFAEAYKGLAYYKGEDARLDPRGQCEEIERISSNQGANPWSVATDLSRMDGTISPGLRAMDITLLKRVDPELGELFPLLVDKTAAWKSFALTEAQRDEERVEFDLGSAQASGEVTTTIMQTHRKTRHLYVALCAMLRELNPKQATATVRKRAWKVLQGHSLTRGDDGVTILPTEAHDDEVLKRVCDDNIDGGALAQLLIICLDDTAKVMGLKSKAVAMQGRAEFLATVFSITGNTQAVRMPTRQLQNMQQTCTATLSPEEAFLMKWVSVIIEAACMGDRQAVGKNLVYAANCIFDQSGRKRGNDGKPLGWPKEFKTQSKWHYYNASLALEHDISVFEQAGTLYARLVDGQVPLSPFAAEIEIDEVLAAERCGHPETAQPVGEPIKTEHVCDILRPDAGTVVESPTIVLESVRKDDRAKLEKSLAKVKKKTRRSPSAPGLRPPMKRSLGIFLLCCIALVMGSERVVVPVSPRCLGADKLTKHYATEEPNPFKQITETKCNMVKARNPVLKRAGEMLIPLAEEAGRELLSKGLKELTQTGPRQKNSQPRKHKKMAGGPSRETFVSQPSTQAMEYSGAPRARKDSTDSSEISGRVLIGHIDVPATGFSSSMLRLNASNERVFPQLAVASRLFTKYKFKQLRFIFSNPGHPTSSSGQFVAGVSYDTTAAAPFDKEEIFNRTNSVKGPIWVAETVLECTDLPKGWSLLEAQVASGSRQNVDIGNLVIGAESLGGPALDNASEVMVEYVCCLKDRRPDMAQDFSAATNGVVLMGATNGTYANNTDVYASWFPPFNCIFEPHVTTFFGAANCGFYLPRGLWRVDVLLQWDGSAGAADYATRIELMRNKVTPVVIGSVYSRQNGSATCRGTMLGTFLVESAGRAIDPEGDSGSDDSCFAIRFFQDSGVTLTMFGVDNTRRRSLILTPM
jgi:hypothetical protein